MRILSELPDIRPANRAIDRLLIALKIIAFIGAVATAVIYGFWLFRDATPTF